jgi:uncharacterized membrane protein YfcA
MEVIGYFAAFFIGLSLGLIGGGGAILTVPVLVYLFGISPLLATSYSLVVVGITSFTASIQSVHKGMVDYKTVLLFGLPSIVTVFITRKLILPAMPGEMHFPGFHLSFSIFTMLLFALLMVLAAVSMIKSKPITIRPVSHGRLFKLLIFGIIVGLITGFLGAGGGFILIPALVLVFHLSMQKAIGTSLFIIAVNSLVGYIADFGHYKSDYHLLIAIVLIAITGAFAGARLSSRIDAHILKSAFGWFVLAIGCFIFIREIMLIH